MLSKYTHLGLAATLFASIGVVAVVAPAVAGPGTVEVLLTNPNDSTRLATSSIMLLAGASTEPVTIMVDTSATYQSIQGFGASFTDSSAFLIDERLNPTRRTQLMSDLFNPETGIGISMLRQPMGATDFNAPDSGLYTYDDRPCDQPDPELQYFSTAHDDAYIIPLLQEALAVAPELTIMATPWSPPAWMRDGTCTTVGTLGGSFKTQYYASYAQYFVKFIQEYAADGVPISYVTPQNEPTNELILLPSMIFPVEQEATFVSEHLGPALQAAGLTTKILGWDYVWDQAGQYPTSLLENAAAAASLVGTAWHCYGGTPAEMTPFRDKFPDKEIYVTECSGLETTGTDADQFKKTMNLFVDSTRNWARSVILWNIALDSFNGPTTGCYVCRALVNIDYSLFDGWVASKQIEYYAVGQIAKWVRPEAIRVGSTTSATGINNVTFVNSDGSKVLVAINNGSTAQTFGVQENSGQSQHPHQWFSYTLPAGASVSFRWTN